VSKNDIKIKNATDQTKCIKDRTHILRLTHILSYPLESKVTQGQPAQVDDFCSRKILKIFAVRVNLRRSRLKCMRISGCLLAYRRRSRVQSNGNSVNFTNLSISIILLPLLPLTLSLEEPKPLSERHLTRFVGRCLGPELCDLLSVVTPWLGDMNRRVGSVKFNFYGLMKELTRMCRSRSSDGQSRRGK
jgi:hypothetical protein